MIRLHEDMNKSLEDQLRKALRPVDPDEGFADRVMTRLESTPAVRPRRRLSQRLRGWPAALAASIILGTTVIYAWHADRERRGLEARRQLLEALHITGEKLDLAYQGVRRESSPPPADDAGA
jgi:hypothetical protein